MARVNFHGAMAHITRETLLMGYLRVMVFIISRKMIRLSKGSSTMEKLMVRAR